MDKTAHKLEQIRVETTAYYSVLESSRESSTPPALLLALHGWGQRCTTFLRSLNDLGAYNVTVVAAQAPHQFYVDPAAKRVGCSWLTAYQRDQSVADNTVYLAALAKHVAETYPVDTGRLFVLGFSQGASMSYRFAVSGLASPKGVIACAADIPPDVIEKFGDAAKFSVLITRGTADTLVPTEVFENNQRILNEAGISFDTFEYGGGHEITPELCRRIGEWIEKH